MGREVCVRTFDDVGSAHLARARLKSAGMRVRLLGTQTVVGADMPGAVRGIRVVVDEADAEDAALLLGPEYAEDPELDDEPGARCPKCDSTYVRETWSPFELAFGVALLGVPFRYMTKKTWCAKCGYSCAREETERPLFSTDYRTMRRREGNPVFRLRRGQAVAGLGVGVVSGLLLTVLDAHAGPWFFILAPFAGTLLGSARRTDVCSGPGCRSPLEKDVGSCPGCGGVISGTIARADQHFVRKAAWHKGAETLDE